MLLPASWRPLSTPRRLTLDFLRTCRGIPFVTLARTMNLAELVAARNAWSPRPQWTAIFVKAFALVCAESPYLRRSYFGFPWPHLYEHEAPTAAVTVERTYQGEEVVLVA